MCVICGTKIGPGERFQIVHRVPFKVGVVDWGLTPDWLGKLENLCLTHPGSCNHAAELTDDGIVEFLKE